MAECAWTRTICEQLRKCGAHIVVLTGSAAVSGLPDRLIVHKLWQGFIEFKAEKTPLKLNQAITINEIQRRVKGFAVIVRKPNLIEVVVPEDSRCSHEHCKFDGTGKDLLQKLIAMKAIATNA